MYIVIFITATIVGLLYYLNTQKSAINNRMRKIGSGFLPKNGLSRYLTYTEPTITSNYLQSTNNYRRINKCMPDQPNLELCSETNSNKIETNIQYMKQPYILQP
jgi:hypothetical protein